MSLPPGQSYQENMITIESVGSETGHVRIGLISDTHIPRDAKMLPPHVAAAFRGIDLILHAGDIYDQAVLDELDEIAPVLAARGNGDCNFPTDRRVEDSHTFDVAGISLGVTHGLAYPRSAKYLHEVMQRQFGRRVDVIVVGDTHVAIAEMFDGIHFVNPGSPTLPRNLYELGTVGLLDITGGAVEAHIVQLDKFPIPFQRHLVYY